MSKTGIPFLVESTKIEKASFPYKFAISEANVKTNRMVSTKWTYHKERSFVSNCFNFCFSSRTFYKGLIWRTNNPNAHICTYLRVFFLGVSLTRFSYWFCTISRTSILTSTILSSHFNIKDDKNKQHKHDLVYFSSCLSMACTDTYIRETATSLSKCCYKVLDTV